MDDLKPFSNESVCIKCGGLSTFCKYEKTRGTDVDGVLYEKEFILRECCRCHYTWPEAPLNLDKTERGE